MFGASEPVGLSPPADVNDEILAVITRADEGTAINNAQRSIVIMREYRNRLMADVVTGKLDVRDAASALPDEPEESELLLDSSDGEAAEELLDDLAQSANGASL